MVGCDCLECTSGGNIILNITWRDRKRAWINEQTKVEDILSTIKRKKWKVDMTGHFMTQRYDRWTIRVTDWQPRDDKRRRADRTRWRDEIESFAGVTWKRQASDRNSWRRLGEVFVLQWTHIS